MNISVYGVEYPRENKVDAKEKNEKDKRTNGFSGNETILSYNNINFVVSSALL